MTAGRSRGRARLGPLGEARHDFEEGLLDVLDSLRIAIAGRCGHSGGYVTRQLVGMPQLRLVAVCDAGLEGAAEEHRREAGQVGQTPRLCASVEELLTVDSDLVVIDGLFADHARHAAAALAAGRHVLCEKPVTLDHAQLRHLAGVQAASGRELLGMYGMRYAAPIATARRLVAEGRIGAVRLVQVQKSYRLGERPWWYRRRRDFGGTIPWVAAHGLDLLACFIAEAPLSVSAVHGRGGNRGHDELESAASCQVTYPDGVVAAVTADYLRPESSPSHEDDRLRVVGTAGILELREGRLWLDGVEQALTPGPSLLADVVAICSGAPGAMSTRQCLASTALALDAREAADRGETVPCQPPTARAAPIRSVRSGDRPDLLLVGLGGFGASHCARAAALAEQGRVRILGGVDPAAEHLPVDHPLRALGCPLYPDLDAALAELAPDLTVVSTPIHLHVAQTLTALRAGGSVLVEKPLCTDLAEARALLDAETAAQGFVAVGFQLAFSPAMRRLKADVLAGRFGTPLGCSALCLWPRPPGYYQRNAWAGRRVDDHGRPILDSPQANAAAHFLFNMLWLLGPSEAEAATPRNLRAALGRAYPIENCDSCLLEVHTDHGVPLRFAASHSIAAECGPILRYDFSEATIRMAPDEGLVARLRDGRSLRYHDLGDRRLEVCRGILRGEDRVPCSAAAAAMHTAVVVAAQRTPIHAPPPERIDRDPATGQLAVRGLAEAMAAMATLNRMPAIDWLPFSEALAVEDPRAQLPPRETAPGEAGVGGGSGNPGSSGADR